MTGFYSAVEVPGTRPVKHTRQRAGAMATLAQRMNRASSNPAPVAPGRLATNEDWATAV